MGKAKKLRAAGAVLLVTAVVGAFLLAARRSEHDKRNSVSIVQEGRWLMGTRWVIQVLPGPERDAHQVARVVRSALDEVARIEAVMSEWQPDSPISAVNRSAGQPPRAVPRELFDLVRRAVALSARSGGAFDVTWKGMGELWDLRAEPFTPPTAEAIAAARGRVDYRKVVFTEGRLGLAAPGMAIGLGGIAKGYAIDRASAVLRAAGLLNHYIDGGGDIRVQGTRGGRPWRVGIRHPRGGPLDLLTVVESSGGAVVTSGDYERFRELDGVRYHHIIDPRTGRPASKCRAVTVVHPQAETADALATAVFVLGPREGLAFARREGAEALVVDAQGKVHRSEGFPSQP